MKFSSKFLKQAGAVVYVLFESDRPITSKNPGDPVGVVSSERVANLFYQRDSTHRNIFEFVLDDLPESTGIPSGPNPPSLESEVDATRRRVDESTRRMEEFLEEMRSRKK